MQENYTLESKGLSLCINCRGNSLMKYGYARVSTDGQSVNTLPVHLPRANTNTPGICNDAMILHICSAAEWQASHDGHYRCPSLDHVGFIHCSTPEQVVEVAGRLFHGRRDLVLLLIDPHLVTAEIRREDGGNGSFYPHIYGPLNVNAVTAVVAFEANPDGSFVLPARLHR